MKINTSVGRHYDFIPPSTGGSSGISQSIINIIEANTSTQTNVLIAEVDMIETNGLLTQVLKYGDNAKTILVYTINLVWTNGVPTSIVSINHDDNLTKTTTLTWYNGTLTNVSNVMS